MYLFCSYLRFKRLYRILDIKLCKYLVFLQNAPLKLKIKALKFFVRVMIKFAKKEWFMKIISIILGILVILSWLFVMKEYRKGNEKTKKGKLVILVACVLTIIMTLMSFFE